MSGFHANAGEIDTFGRTLSEVFAPRATTILDNARNAELHFADFGPLLAAYCSDSWSTHYNSLLGHLADISTGVPQAAAMFKVTAETYAGTDAQGAQDLGKLADDLHHRKDGTLPDAKSAPKDAPADGWWRDTANSYYDKPGERTSYGGKVVDSIPGFPGGVVKTAKALLDVKDADLAGVIKVITDGGLLAVDLFNNVKALAENPLSFLAKNGLGFLLKVCTPLKQLLDTVATGNPDALKAASSRFADIAKDLERFATDLVGAAQRDIQTWSGDAAVAAAAKLDEFVKAVHGTAAVAGGTAGLLQLIAVLSQALEDVVLGIVSDVVAWLLPIWIKALAAAAPTAGASTAEATVETEFLVARETEKAVTFVEKVIEIFTRVAQAFVRLARKVLQNNTFQEGVLDAGERLVGADDGKLGILKKAADYGKTATTTVKDYTIGTDESDEEIDQQLDFDGR